MSHTTLTDPRLSRQTRRSLRPVPVTRRSPAIIRPFAAPVVRELPPRRTAAGTGW